MTFAAPLSEAPGAADGKHQGLQKSFLVAYGAYLVIALTKVHMLVPQLAALPFAKVTGLVLVVLCFMQLRRADLARVQRSRVGKAVLFLGIWGFLSIPFSVWPGMSFNYAVGDFWKTLLLFYITATALLDMRAREVAIAALGIGAVLNAVKVVIFGAGEMANRTYASSAFDPNESAAVFLLGIPMLIYLAGRYRGTLRWMALISLPVLAVGIVRCSSRGGFVGLAALMLWLIAKAPRKRRGSIILGVVTCAVAFVVTASDTTWARVDTIFAPKEDYNYTTKEGRVEVWKRGVGYMLRRPVFGVGFKAFTVADGTLSGKVDEGFGIRYSAAHNSLVEVGAELGIPGLIAFLIAITGSMRALSLLARPGPDPRDTAFGAAMAAGLFGWAVAAFFLSMAYYPITFFLFGVGAASWLIRPRGYPRQSRRGTVAVPVRMTRGALGREAASA